MTGKEIVRELRSCAYWTRCEKCPARNEPDCIDANDLRAADAIERLTAENAALREKVPQWISVEPSRIRELAEADKDGRVVVLPCKVGDTVWIVGTVRKLYSAKVRTFFCGHPSAVRGDDDGGHIHMIRTTECDIPMQEFGKTVFLSREEAEKALQEMEGKKDGNKTSM